MAKLIITLPNSRDVIHELTGEVVTVGRSADNKVQINHDSISGHHAKFILTKGRYRLKDLDSTNKTCINALPISEAVLSGSCVLRFGTVECTFKEDVAAPGENISTQLADAHRQIAALMRARDALHEQNQLVAKQRDGLQISNDDLADKVSDIEAEKDRVLQERDALLAQAAGLSHREVQIQALEQERDSLRKIESQLREQMADAEKCSGFASEEHEKAIQEAANGRMKIESLRGELDTARSAGEKAAAQIDAANKRMEELLEKRSLVDSEAEVKLGEAAKQIEGLEERSAHLASQLDEAMHRAEQSARERAEIDGRLAETQRLFETVQAECKKERGAHVKLSMQLAKAEEKSDELLRDRDSSIAETGAKLDEARNQIEALESEREKVVRTTGELNAQLDESKQEANALRKAHEATTKAKEKLVAKLEETKKRVDQLLSEREAKVGAVSDELENAREQIEALETERETAVRTSDELNAQLAESKKQADGIRKEQEAVAKAKEKLAAQLEQTEKKLDELSRKHESNESEAARKLGESEKRMEGLLVELDGVKKSGDQSTARITESERLVQETRAERDSATQKNEKLEVELAETRKQLDQVVKMGSLEAGEIGTRLEEAQKQIDAIQSERDEAGRANAELTSQLDSAKKKAEELVRNKGAEVDEIACSLNEAQKRIDAITRERDGVKKASERLEAEMEETKHQFELQIQGRETESAGKLKAMQEQVAALGGERETLSNRIQELSGALESHQKQVAALQESQEAARQKAEALAVERESKTGEIAGELSEARDQITALSKQSQELLAELNAHREKLKANESEKRAAKESSGNLAQELDEAKRLIQELEQKQEAAFSASAEKFREAKNELEAIRFERATLEQKNQELSAQIEADRKQISAIKAEREAARMTLKSLESRDGDSSSKTEAPNHRVPALDPVNGSAMPLRLQIERNGSDSPASAIQAAASAKIEPPTLPKLRLDRKSASASDAKIDDAAVRSILPAVPQTVTIIRSSLQYFLRHQHDHKLVEQLHRSAQMITEKTSQLKLHPVHRLSTAIETMLRDFVKFPEQINGGSLRSLGMGLESLATLLDEKNVFRASHLPPANVFAIDDNEDVQREIVSAAELVRMKVTCADTPTKALEGLGEKPVDLILLDINLPEMTGFDLCTRVRSLPEHRKTPIVFITGAGTPENRAQSLLTGGNDFIAKPFDLAEMNVKTLSWVFKGQLELT